MNSLGNLSQAQPSSSPVSTTPKETPEPSSAQKLQDVMKRIREEQSWDPSKSWVHVEQETSLPAPSAAHAEQKITVLPQGRVVVEWADGIRVTVDPQENVKISAPEPKKSPCTIS
ncbi:MAG: hypothetical protein NTZ52_03000 [Chlamydiae bacterium]|nr:hypothetical protein [Chlamydiota bacterium]